MSDEVGRKYSRKLSNASFVGVVINIDTPQCSHSYFLRKQSWCQWLWASPGRRSLLLMFGLGFRHMQQRLEYIWPQLRRTHRLHTERNFGQVHLAPAHATWLGFKWFGIPDIARKERSFRDQRVILRSFSTSANSSMVKMIFLGELSSLAVSGKVYCFSLCPNIVFEGMTWTMTMIRFTESSSVSRVVTSQMVRRPDSNNLYI